MPNLPQTRHHHIQIFVSIAEALLGLVDGSLDFFLDRHRSSCLIGGGHEAPGAAFMTVLQHGHDRFVA